MADTYGELEIPLTAAATGEAVGDPCLSILADYFSAVLASYCTTAWQSVAPAQPVVRATHTHDPQRGAFSDRDLPAIYLWRLGQAQPPSWGTADWEITEDTVRLLWVLPPTKQEVQRVRDSIVNGVVKVLLAAVGRERDPAYEAAGDPDTKAATLAARPTAIKLSVATSTGAVSYSGAALDGAVGVGTIAPPLPFTLTAGGSAGNFTVGSLAVVTGTNALGLAQTSTLTITGPGTFTTTDEYTAVTSLAIGAQAGTGGTFTAGLGPFAGDGSVVRNFASLFGWMVAKWQLTTLPIQIRTGNGDAVTTRTYDALAIDIAIREQFVPDLSRFYPQTNIDLSYLRSDDTVSETSALPDNADG